MSLDEGRAKEEKGAKAPGGSMMRYIKYLLGVLSIALLVVFVSCLADEEDLIDDPDIDVDREALTSYSVGSCAQKIGYAQDLLSNCLRWGCWNSTYGRWDSMSSDCSLDDGSNVELYGDSTSETFTYVSSAAALYQPGCNPSLPPYICYPIGFFGGVNADWEGILFIDGNGGNDYLYGPNDNGNANFDVYLRGGTGNDFLYAAFTSPVTYGSNTYLQGEDDSDHLFADNTGATKMYGGNGNDYLYGGAGADYMNGNAGADWLFGYGGSDTMYCDDSSPTDTGSCLMSGGAGADTIYGADGNDLLCGGNVNTYSGVCITNTTDDLADTIRGYGGDDEITGDLGTNTVDGGEGYDECAEACGDWENGGVLRNQHCEYPCLIASTEICTYGRTVIYGIISSQDSENTGEHIVCCNNGDGTYTEIGHSEGSAAIVGTDNDDTILGHVSPIFPAHCGGHHLLAGSNAHIFLVYGQGGDDSIDCGGSGCYVKGGTGNDVIIGSMWDDILDGESENDHIHGGFGHDHIEGGAGHDYLFGEGDGDEITDSDSNADCDCGVDDRPGNTDTTTGCSSFIPDVNTSGCTW